MTDTTLTPEERQIIELIAQGMARWGIAARLGISQDRVRTVIRRLCERFDCRMIDLPAAVGIKTVADDPNPAA